MGFLEGRRVELIVQQAVEHARRAVVVSDPDAFADNLLQGISERLGRIPTRTRAEIENDCNRDLAGTWQPLPDPVKQSLIEAEWLKQLLENNDGRDYRGVVIGYGAVLEGLLRHLDGSKDNLSQFRQRIRRYRERRIPFLRVGSVNEEFVRRVDEFVDIRDTAAHGDDKKQHDISRSLMLKARDTIFGTTDKPSILARLVKARET